MALPLFVETRDSEYGLPTSKFHISLEYSMNGVAVILAGIV
jgi:hypothetical protein